MSKSLVTFNAGSSTVKIGVFDVAADRPHRLTRAVIDFRHDPLTLSVGEGKEVRQTKLDARPGEDLTEVVSETFAGLARHFDIGEIVAAGHRVVHGGDRFAGPVRLDAGTIDAIAALTPLAPLHQPQNLRLIRAISDFGPKLVQVASFDTAFHRTNAEIVRRFAIPREFHDRGVKRYGFHGLSYKYIAGELARRTPQAVRGKVVAAHLGSGASLCAMEDGASRDTSMGFSTLDGVPMATRCGALDPGVLLHLFGAGGLALAEVEAILYHRSGLLGVSGISADSRVLLESKDPRAREAIDLFTLRIAGEVARLTATLGGLDTLVFTAGIGENQPSVRAGVCTRLDWLGVELDAAANERNAAVVSSKASRVAVLVIPTDEEQVIAEEAFSVVKAKAA
ncbi:acetate/propionate family kinase [Mesorhizobium sp. LHD-90]|uniref:acetate/propionate family kinase n=1 Tax=Mesorhizobium sp. LHD-90 TaxID=3071414 RepID=UPI0027E1A666|nr:acetate/propionate family kinase [Mesorhizobium sp. LHD-90]MDQ6435595.1 acetate/propionate family kinase [Mesorhizobium sp. LHD-90]